jgi:hypothetical protein
MEFSPTKPNQNLPMKTKVSTTDGWRLHDNRGHMTVINNREISLYMEAWGYKESETHE